MMKFLGLHDNPFVLKSIHDVSRVITLKQLSRFLECPVQSMGRKFLSLKEKEDENLSRIVHEPVSLPLLKEWELLQKTLYCGLAADTLSPDWSVHYRKALQEIELVGSIHCGLFREAMEAKHIKVLSGWQQQLMKVFPKLSWSEIRTSFRKYIHGPLREDHPILSLLNSGTGSNESCINLRPPLLIRQNDREGTQETKINAEGEWTFAMKEHSWNIFHFSISGIRPKHWLNLFLNGIYFTATGIMHEKEKLILTCLSTNSFKMKEFHLPDQQVCLSYLEGLSREMMVPNAAVLFPVEAVFELEKERLSSQEYPSRLEEWLNENLDSPRRKISSHYGPVSFPEDALLPDDPESLLRDRFGLLFQTLGNPG